MFLDSKIKTPLELIARNLSQLSQSIYPNRHTASNNRISRNQFLHHQPNLKFIFICSIILFITTTATTILLSVAISNQIRDNSSFVERPHDVLELTSDNFDASTSKYMVVVINFYADWCPFSARWKPVFQSTAQNVYNQTSSHYASSTIVFGQVNCVIETTLAQRFRVSKYPTTKLTIDGKTLKKEYRGARNLDAFKEYIMKVLNDPVTYLENYSELHDKIDENKGALILLSGYHDESINKLKRFKHAESTELEFFKRIARQLREDCQFFHVNATIPFGDANGVLEQSLYQLKFKPQHKSLGSEITFTGNLKDMHEFSKWSKDNCVPLVREITFGNAEELTEEGLPFVILFYEPKDKTPIELYKRVVEEQLREEANSVTFLYADGHVFSHPLMHLGKTKKDLPLLAIDSFKHLFLYKEPVESISQPGKLKQFVQDLHSGKLDREFHFGPDLMTEDKKTSIPESAFQKLAPSPYRYSFTRDEL